MSPPMTARLAGLIERIGPLPIDPSWMYTVIRHGQRNMDLDVEEGFHEPNRQCGDSIGELINALPDLLARIAALESVSLASIPFRVEAVAHLEAQERYREHRHGEPDTTEKMLRAALNVIRDMDNAARAALTLKENEDV